MSRAIEGPNAVDHPSWRRNSNAASSTVDSFSAVIAKPPEPRASCDPSFVLLDRLRDLGGLELGRVLLSVPALDVARHCLAHGLLDEPAEPLPTTGEVLVEVVVTKEIRWDEMRLDQLVEPRCVDLCLLLDDG